MDRIAVRVCKDCKFYMSTNKVCSSCCILPELPRFEPAVPPCPTIESAFNRQVDGQHYTDCAIQPFEFSMANKLDPMQHTIIKYVTRFRSKNGIVDLEKAKHTLELLIEWEKNHATQKN